MKLAEELKIGTTKELLAILVPALATVLVTIWISIQDPLASILLERVPKSILVLLPLVTLSLLGLAISYIFSLRRKLKPKLHIALGVYWDDRLNPYCPSCQKLLSSYANYNYHPGMKCIACDRTVHFSDQDKMFMKLDEAKEKAEHAIAIK